MKLMRSTKMHWCAAALGALLLMISNLSAQQKAHAQNGFYVGLAVPRNTIAGSFDGESVLTGGGEIIIVPKVASNLGIGVLFGGRTGRSALELSYLRSNHTFTFWEASGKAEYHVLSLDVRYYLTAAEMSQPFLLVGGVLDWLIVKDGSASETKIGNATFEGGGFNLGGGLAIYFHPRISFSGEAVYRLIGYGGEHSVKGVMGEWTGINDKDFSGGGVNFTLGLRLTL